MVKNFEKSAGLKYNLANDQLLAIGPKIQSWYMGACKLFVVRQASFPYGSQVVISDGQHRAENNKQGC
jgi:hypothetical protein